MSSKPILEARALRVRREGRTLLEEVSFAVGRGTIHALTGPNGAGKSTLLAAVLGAIQFEGEVLLHFEGQGRIGYVPQSFAADRTLPMTAEEFLALSRQRRPLCLGVTRAAREKARELLERVGLAGLGERQISVLSGGELRRLLLANALDPAPELLLVDEPAAGLDEAGQKQLDGWLAQARDEHGASVLLVSHDAAQVARLADASTRLGALA